MTRNVDPKKASRYIIKSEEFLETANIALQSAKVSRMALSCCLQSCRFRE